ncbi:MAG: hypothetical protein CMF61_07250 [Magnetococcales bacterium]|nr:hypothetical protein [Magnetococcales bacterium]|tara:strand:+ start:189 stop:503 length:315 start_codon:yes stop_codon:yes gene_type:complete
MAMLICACAGKQGRRSDYVSNVIKKFIDQQGLTEVDAITIVKVRLMLNEATDRTVGCGTCMGAIQSLVIEIAKEQGLLINKNAYTDRKQLREMYLHIAEKRATT